MLWLNGMTVAVSGSMLAAEQLDLTHKYGITLPEDHIKWAMFLVGVLSILLRLRTTRPLATGAGQSVPEPALQGAKPLT